MINTAEFEAGISVQAGNLMHRLHVLGWINLSASQANTMQLMIESAMLRAGADALKMNAEAFNAEATRREYDRG